MNRSTARNRWSVVDTISYLMIASVAARMLPYYLPTENRWIVIGLLALYLILFTAARFFFHHFPTAIHPYFVVQIAIAQVLTLVLPSYEGPQDYFANLILPLCIQANWQLLSKTRAFWVGIFALAVGLSMILYYQKNEQSWEGIGLGLMFAAACFLISVFSAATLRAEEARRETQALNAELQAANRKLQDYAVQVEQMAAAEARARLARDLHDSVSQTIFSMTLTAQAARILLDRDPARVAGQLAHLQSLANHALSEMRSLIQHLRPASVEQEGLAASLRRHALERKLRDGMVVDLEITGSRRLPPAVEEGLFRVVQESLNNVVKHARVSSARVTLHLDQNPIGLCIEDQGVGFQMNESQPSAGHMGLSGMAERVRSLGGRLAVESHPGAGTRIWVEDVRVEEEGEHAGKP